MRADKTYAHPLSQEAFADLGYITDRLRKLRIDPEWQALLIEVLQECRMGRMTGRYEAKVSRKAFQSLRSKFEQRGLFLSFNRGAMPSAKSEGARILDVAFIMPRFLLVTHLRVTPLRHTFNHQKNSPARRWSQNLVPGSHGSMQTASTKGHVRSFHFTGHACRANIVAVFRFPIRRSFRLTAAEPGSLPEEVPLTVEELVPVTDVATA